MTAQPHHEGIRAAVAAGATVGLRVTLQRANYRELPRFVTLAHELGVNQLSFLAVDVSNPHAFARVDDFSTVRRDVCGHRHDHAIFDQHVSLG